MIDTLATSRKLITSGFPQEQAEALTEVIADEESTEIKKINKKIDVLDNNMRDLQKNVDILISITRIQFNSFFVVLPTLF